MTASSRETRFRSKRPFLVFGFLRRATPLDHGRYCVLHCTPLPSPLYPPNPENYDEPGYQHPCKGDLGGGHWMDGGNDGTKKVLVGIHVTSSEPCGRHSRMLKLNNHEFLEWIKKHSCVENEPTCKCWPVCSRL